MRSLSRERVLTAQELQDFVDASPPGSRPESPNAGPAHFTWMRRIPPLRHVLARRWAREGHWDKAASLLPEPLMTQAEDMHEHLAAAQDESLPPRIRAEHFFAMGEVIRNQGPELFNPELIPGWGFNPPEGFPEDLSERIGNSQKPYPKMNYFIPVAADYMWQAAELLPDNDPLTAHALYLGGTYLKNKDPQGADRFYKALVRRNPNLLIARKADRLHWFPDKFTDVVLYQSRPVQHWYDRKRNQALAGLAVAAAVVFLVAAGWALRKRKSQGQGLPPISA